VTSRFGTTPLMAAARYSESSQVVRLLLEAGADPHAKNRVGSDALASAADAGDVETYRLLLARGVKPENLISPAMMGHEAIVELALSAGANINFDGDHAGHALNFALYGNQPQIAKLLIARGVDLTLRSPRGEHHTPPIVWAAYNESGDASVGQAMIEKGVDVNTLTESGESALDWARGRNNKALEVALLKAGGREGPVARKQKLIPMRELPSDDAALDRMIRDSASRAIKLLQRSSDAFLESRLAKGNCVSCHQQTLPAVVFSLAMERGIAVDENSIGRQVQDQVEAWKKNDKIAKSYELIRPQPDTPILVGYGLTGLAALRYPADALTDAMVWYLMATQRRDGSWPAADYRPPMEDGPIQGAAFAIRALQLYPPGARESELRDRIGRAADYLLKARPSTFNQQVFQLLGLGWAGLNEERLRPLVAEILKKQQPDGGWAQLDGLKPDAWATGQALVALNAVGGVATSDTAYEKGIRFLLSTQFEDGSWYVRSRAWPFQPHFESEFPHGKDQWISASGTAFAAMALLLTQPKGNDTVARDWMAIQVRKGVRASGTVSAAKMPAEGRKVDFSQEIQPLLERSCGGCHGGERKKGEFSIENRENLLKGGQSGEPALIAGDSVNSKLVRMVSDEVEDLEMPPRGKRDKYPGLSKSEIALLKAWIDGGLQ
ncbi:MAG: ankyrin repeat domain-containing protein, partial [Limisphaerales bacterium]